MKHQTNPSALPHSEAAPAEGIVTNTPPAKEGQGWSAPAAVRLPYIAPAIEVIEVRTERGYAASADGYDFGNGGRW